MTPDQLIAQLDRVQTWFDRSTSSLTEDDATFCPVEGTYTSAQLIGHVGQTVDWFFEGAFGNEGFNLDQEAHDRALAHLTTLEDARAWVRRAFDQARETLRGKTAEELATPLPEGPVMGGAPRFAIVGGIEEHTAHHRGALAVYARLRGHTPPMPYM